MGTFKGDYKTALLKKELEETFEIEERLSIGL